MSDQPGRMQTPEKGPSVASYRFDNDLRYRAEDHEGQTHLTPAYVLDPVRAVLGGIGLDPCTLPSNPVNAERFYALPTDGAAEPWDADTIFCNPPYGKARERWVAKCVTAGQEGRRVVLLIPAHTDTRVWQKAAPTTSHVVFIKGRVKFGIPRPNGRQVAASHPSALLCWNIEDASPLAVLGLVVPHAKDRPEAVA